jgi:hypothetical protein
LTRPVSITARVVAVPGFAGEILHSGLRSARSSATRFGIGIVSLGTVSTARSRPILSSNLPPVHFRKCVAGGEQFTGRFLGGGFPDPPNRRGNIFKFLAPRL